ncbi:MAG: ABC transporter transmembrane domain-containing protein, partial [Ignavibacteria bacterium]
SILGLVVPLSSQAIVNAVALGVHTEQLVVLCGIVLFAMLAMAVILVFQRHVIDYIQRRQFIVTARDIVAHLPKVQESVYEETYAPELVNRFFDVVTVQKSISKFLLDGMAALLSLLSGLIVLGIYHPIFLIYDILFLMFIPVLVFVLGRNALSTAIDESSNKYRTVEWIEEVARSHRSIKQRLASGYATNKVEDLAFTYAEAKEQHFRILARQILGSYVFKAFAIVGILALGGDLVIRQQISLGQLVAAEIIIVLLLNSLDKLLSVFDTFYEFAAALTKIQSLKDLPIESDGRATLTPGQSVPAAVFCDVVLPTSTSGVKDKSLSCMIEAGTSTALVASNPHEASHIGKLLCGLHHCVTGHVEVFGVHANTVRVDDLHTHLCYIDREDVVHQATIYDNISMGRDIDSNLLKEILRITHLDEEVRQLANGIHTATSTLGRNLTHSLRARIALARGLAGKPSLLVVGGLPELFEPAIQLQIIKAVQSIKGLTSVWISLDRKVITSCTNVVVVHDGKLEYEGASSEALTHSVLLQSIAH